MKVLLADDSGLILERLQEMLGILDQVEITGSFKNGTDTLAAIRTMKPDLVILDIKMPGLSGLEVLAEVRKEDQMIKFIILTFNSTDDYKQLAIQLGADYFFNKADEFDKVSLVVAGLAEKAKNENMAKKWQN